MKDPTMIPLVKGVGIRSTNKGQYFMLSCLNQNLTTKWEIVIVVVYLFTDFMYRNISRWCYVSLEGLKTAAFPGS